MRQLVYADCSYITAILTSLYSRVRKILCSSQFSSQRSFIFTIFIFVSVGDVARMVHNNVASKDPNICYAAKLLGMQGEKFSKPKKVVCFISPKQLTIKEYLLRIIPKRLVTFRLCPSTKVSSFNFSEGKN